MKKPESKDPQKLPDGKGISPVWLLGGMAAVFIAIMIFEIFFKAKH